MRTETIEAKQKERLKRGRASERLSGERERGLGLLSSKVIQTQLRYICQLCDSCGLPWVILSGWTVLSEPAASPAAAYGQRWTWSFRSMCGFRKRRLANSYLTHQRWEHLQSRKDRIYKLIKVHVSDCYFPATGVDLFHFFYTVLWIEWECLWTECLFYFVAFYWTWSYWHKLFLHMSHGKCWENQFWIIWRFLFLTCITPQGMVCVRRVLTTGSALVWFSRGSCLSKGGQWWALTCCEFTGQL